MRLGEPAEHAHTTVKLGYLGDSAGRPAPLRLPSAAECVRFERESFGALHQMLAAVPKQERDQVWADVERELAGFETAGGFVGPCELLIGSGVK